MREMQIKKRKKQLEKERKEREKEQKKLAKKNKKEKKEQQKEARYSSSTSALPNAKGMSNEQIDKTSNNDIPKSKSEGFISNNDDDKKSSRESIVSQKSHKGLKSRIKSLLDFKSKKNLK